MVGLVNTLIKVVLNFALAMLLVTVFGIATVALYRTAGGWTLGFFLLYMHAIARTGRVL